MKLFCLFTFCLITGLSLAQSINDDGKRDLKELEIGFRKTNPNERRIALRRVVRNTFFEFSEQFIKYLKYTFTSNCKLIGKEEAVVPLQDTYSDMESCVGKKRIIATPRAEFISNMEECSQDAITKTKDCLDENQKFLPDFLMTIAKSVIHFMYDEVTYFQNEFASCALRLGEHYTQYMQCLTDIAAKYPDAAVIPSSKEEFCKTYIPANVCFTDMLKEACGSSNGLDKFREGYLNALNGPCEV